MTTSHLSTRYFFGRVVAVVALTVAVGGTASAQSQSPRTCKTTADCGPDETCEGRGGGSNSSGCDPGQTCVFEPPVITVQYSCFAKPRACMADSQCPFPLVCSDAFGSDDTVTTNTEPAVSPSPTPAPAGDAPKAGLVAMAPIPTPTPTASRVCTWKVVACQTTADCGDARLECIEFGRSTHCTGSGSGSGGTTGSSGGGTMSTPTTAVSTTDLAPSPGVAAPAPIRTDCKEVVTKACFPKITPCSASRSQCADGQVCHDFNDSPDAPFYVAGTPNQFCVPQGIELAINGKAQVDSSTLNIGGGRQEGTAEGSSFFGGVGKGTRGAAATPTAANDTTKSGGCSVVRQQGSSTASLSMILLGLLCVLARRRNRFNT